VHDNWPATTRNVKVPLGNQLAAITRVRGFTILVSDPFFSGHHERFGAEGGALYAPTWLAYSLDGPGATFIPQLGVVIDLANPVQAGPMKKTDDMGNVVWDLFIPPGAAGLMVWFQAVQAGQATNVVERYIL